MIAVPAPIPVTIPDAEPTDAMVGALLVHVPPEGVPESVIVEPTQTVPGPAMVADE